MLTVRLDSPVPLADQVRAGLRGAIARGELGPGDSLPPVRQLAGDLGINLNTVARAYRSLEAAGLVTTVRGRGTVVASNRESPRQPRARLQNSLRLRLRDLLADARLGGLDRQAVRTLLDSELGAFWPRKKT